MSEAKKEKRKLSKGSLKKSLKLYKYVKPYQAEFALGLVFLVLSSLANLALPKFMGDLVDASN
jgi:ABC-type multidrug transport system fused ATPase/permease subunit